MRTPGTQGLAVSTIGYGAMGTATGHGPTDGIQSITAIRRAHELGVTHFDAAEMYGWGEGEKLLGHALAPVRDEVTIATKFGLRPSSGQDSHPEHIREVSELKLRRGPGPSPRSPRTAASADGSADPRPVHRPARARVGSRAPAPPPLPGPRQADRCAGAPVGYAKEPAAVMDNPTRPTF